jgi:hypothetical protein
MQPARNAPAGVLHPVQRGTSTQLIASQLGLCKWGYGGGAGGGWGEARAGPPRPGRGPQPAVCRVAAVLRRCWPSSPCLGAARCGLCLVAGGGGWCWCGADAYASRSVAACNRGPPSSTSASTSGLSRPVLPRRLWQVVGWVGFLLGRDLWGGERVVGGVLPHINIGTNV